MCLCNPASQGNFNNHEMRRKGSKNFKITPRLVKNIKTTIHVNWRELEEAAQDVVKESGGCVKLLVFA